MSLELAAEYVSRQNYPADTPIVKVAGHAL